MLQELIEKNIEGTKSNKQHYFFGDTSKEVSLFKNSTTIDGSDKKEAKIVQ